MANSTKTTRRKLVQRVKAATYGVALRVANQATQNNYGDKVKRYGPHRKLIANAVKTLRHKKRHLSGIMPSSKSVRGSESVR